MGDSASIYLYGSCQVAEAWNPVGGSVSMQDLFQDSGCKPGFLQREVLSGSQSVAGGGVSSN